MIDATELVRWGIYGLCLAAVGAWMWMCLHRSRDPAALVFRWVLTVVIVAFFWWYVGSCFEKGGQFEIAGLLAGAVGGCCLAVVWVPTLVDFVGRRFSGLYDGGDDEVEPKPFYSIFRAKRAQGKYNEALDEVRKQLGRFPTDFEGQMLLAELQAKDLKNLPEAEAAVGEIINQPGHAPINISYALNQLADWQVQLGKDADAARQSLQLIVDLLPDTEMALQASQRIGRLEGTEAMIAAPQSERRIRVTPGVKYMALQANQDQFKPKEVDQDQLAAEYVKQLEQYPLDGHARESLAVLYANHYKRLDLATDQLEQLIQQSNAPAKQVVRWLNLLADLQVRLGATADQAQATLQRIVDRYPDLAVAENTRRRMETLKLEIHGQKPEKQAVHLEVHEDNLFKRKR